MIEAGVKGALLVFILAPPARSYQEHILPPGFCADAPSQIVATEPYIGCPVLSMSRTTVRSACGQIVGGVAPEIRTP